MKNFPKKLGFHLPFILIISLMVFLPVIKKISLTPPGSFYTRPHGLTADYYQYLSLIRQGRTSFTEINLYTTEATPKETIHLFYLILGRIAQIAGLGEIDIYYLAMYGGLLAFYIFTYQLVKLVVPKNYQFFAMFIIFFTSPFPDISLELFGTKLNLGTSWWTRMDAYSRMTLAPHHFFATSALVSSFYFFLQFWRQKKMKFAILCSLASFLGIVSFAVPGFVFLVSLIPVVSGFSLKFLFKKQRDQLLFRAKGLIVIFFVLIFSLMFVSFNLSSLGKMMGENFSVWEYYVYLREVYPYTFSVFFISYGILPLFILASLTSIFRQKKFEQWLVFSMFVTPFALYLFSLWGILHINKIRFVYSGPYVFAGILSTLGIAAIFKMVKTKRNALIFKSVLIFVLLINSILGFYSYWVPVIFRQEIYFNTYIPSDYFKAIDYLKKTAPLSKIMTTYYTGVFLPAFLSRKVYIGHEVATLDFSRKWWFSNAFYEGKLTSQEAEELLRLNGINYVFWDRGKLPSYYEGILKDVFSVGGVTIYKVIS